MTAHDHVLLCLTAISVGLRPAESFSLTAEEWELLFSQACRQNVAALVCEALERCTTDVPLPTKLKFAAVKRRTAVRYAERRRLMVKLLKLWNSAGIETMLIKGLDTCRHYPDPALRSFGDVDTYNLGRQAEADRLVAEHFGVKVSTTTHHHNKYTLDGILVENHYDFIARYGNRGNARMESVLKSEAAKARIEYVLDGEACLLPPPTFSALFHLRHMAAHFAADRITVRHLVDWALFCRDEEGGVDWPYVASVAKTFGFLPFACCLEDICQHYFALTPHFPLSELPTPLSTLSSPFSDLGSPLSVRALSDILVGEMHLKEPSSRRPIRRLAFKWRRLRASQWKHDLCYSAPWEVDLLYGLWAKILKPHTILH